MFRLHQAACHGSRHEKGGAHVERHNGVEVINRHIDEGLGPIGSSVVDKNAEGCGRRQRPLHGGKVGDVENERLGELAPLADCRGSCFDLRLGACSKRDVRHGVGERKSRRKADAATGARHERPFTLKAEGRRSRDLHHYSAAPA